MRKTLFILVCLSFIFSAPIHAFKKAEGYLFIIGGSHRPVTMMKKFIELSRESSNGKTVIFPMASSEPAESGQSMVEEFKNFGVQDVEYHVLNREQALKEENAKILDNVRLHLLHGRRPEPVNSSSRQYTHSSKTP